VPLEKDMSHSCIDQIAGTSTGGIIAIDPGLGLSVTVAEFVEFYTNHGPTIFPSTSLARRWSGVRRPLFQPKHSHLTLRDELT